MKKFLLPFLGLFFIGISLNAQTITATALGGSWENTSTWVGGVVPANGDTVVIPVGSVVNTIGLGGLSKPEELTTNTPKIYIYGRLQLGDPNPVNGFSYDFLFDSSVQIIDSLGGSLVDSTASSVSYGGGTPIHDFGFAYSSSIDLASTADTFYTMGPTYIYGVQSNTYNTTGDQPFGVSPTKVHGGLLITIDGSGNVTSVALAVRFLNFSASYLPSGETVLEWTTAEEQHSDYFSIERSQDGQSFREIGQVRAAGNSAKPLDYTYSDPLVYKLGSQVLYYRLKLVNQDHSFQYSQVLRISLNGTSGIQKLWPNPSPGQFRVSLGQAPDQKVGISVMSSDGRLIRQYETRQAYQDINLLGQPSGLYLIRLQYANGQTRVLKALIQ